MFSSVCDATCPRLSPVTSTVAPERSASALAIRSMKRRYSTTRSGRRVFATISRCKFPNGTSISVERTCHRVRCAASSAAFSRLAADTSGCAWKCTKSSRSPRRIMRYAATGESIPPDSSAIPRPVTPTGSPPAPANLPADTYAASFIISIEIVSSGALRSTSKPSASCTSPPTARSISTEFIANRLSSRLVRTAKVRALLPVARLIASREIDSISRGVE